MKALLRFVETKKRVFFLLFLALILLYVTGRFLSGERHDVQVMYHQSLFNEYASEIERALSVGVDAEPLLLRNVYGGVVSHHVPIALPRLVAFYERLRATREIKRFIIIGPDHTNAGKEPIIMSRFTFFTSFGEVRPALDIVSRLERAKLAVVDEPPFDFEHSIGSQMLLISRIFPRAYVVPIIFRSDATKEDAGAIGRFLAQFLDDETVLIASIDFSHYLSTQQAMPIDQVSAAVIQNLDSKALSLVKADSNASVNAFIEAMREKKAMEVEDFVVLNTNDLMQNSDYTTGYIFGYWGNNQ